MNLKKDIFDNEDSLNNHIEENYEISLDVDANRNAFDFELVETENSFIVAYLEHDDDAQDYFESDEGAGTFIEFNKPEERNKKMAELSKTKKLFYLVDKYDHSSVHYSISETTGYPDKQWDVTQGKAVFIPCNDVQSQYRKYKKEHGEVEAFQHFIKTSNSTLDEYSNWCNGDVYGYNIKTFNKEGTLIDSESSYGYIGCEYANSEKSNQLKNAIDSENIQALAKNVSIETLTKEDIKTLPFKIMRKGFESGSIARVYDDIIITAKYEGEDKSVVYQWAPSLEKPTISKFEQWQKDYGTTPEQFLEARMKSDINQAIRIKLKNDPKPQLTM